MTESKEKKECEDCGKPTTWRVDGAAICPSCASQRLKGGFMKCKSDKSPCKPIGSTLNGTLLVACIHCGQVYADIPGIAVTRGGAAAAHQAHNLKVAGSSPAPATRKKVVQKTVKKVVKTSPGKSQKQKMVAKKRPHLFQSTSRKLKR